MLEACVVWDTAFQKLSARGRWTDYPSVLGFLQGQGTPCLPSAFRTAANLSSALVDAADKGRGPIAISTDYVPGVIGSDSE